MKTSKIFAMELLKGKVILVSGASSGIGEGVCEALVKCGMKVVGIARRGERLNALGAKLAKEVGEFHGLVADVSIEADILNVFDYIRKRLGTIHAVVNNAAVVKKTSLIGMCNLEISIHLWLILCSIRGLPIKIKVSCMLRLAKISWQNFQNNNAQKVKKLHFLNFAYLELEKSIIAFHNSHP